MDIDAMLIIGILISAIGILISFIAAGGLWTINSTLKNIETRMGNIQADLSDTNKIIIDHISNYEIHALTK